MNGLTSSLNGKLALRQPPRAITRQRAQHALDTGSPDSESVLKLLMCDPLAAINVLKRANESYYGMRGSVGSLSHAIEILGAASVMRQLAQAPASAIMCPTDSPAQQVLIRHAMATAQIGHRIANGHWLHAENVPFQPGIVATTGLLHNIGRLAFSVSLPLETDSLYGFSGTPFPISGPLTELEQLQFGLNHAEMGEFILHHLQFPEEMVEAVRTHRCASDPTAPKHPSRLSWIVGAACFLAESAGYGLYSQVSFHHPDLDAAFDAYDRGAAMRHGDLTRIRDELATNNPLVFTVEQAEPMPEESPELRNAPDREAAPARRTQARMAHEPNPER